MPFSGVAGCMPLPEGVKCRQKPEAGFKRFLKEAAVALRDLCT